MKILIMKILLLNIKYSALGIVVFAGLMISSCKNENNDLVTVQCDSELNIRTKVPLQESYRIPNYYNVQLAQNYLIIEPFNSHRLFFYDLEGELIHEINKYGSGPGDFGMNGITYKLFCRTVIHPRWNECSLYYFEYNKATTEK